MDNLRSILRDITLVTYAVAGVFLCIVLWKTSSAVDGVNKTLATVNAPCTGFHGSVTCGPIAQISQTTKNIGILAAQGAEQVKQTGAVLTAAASTIQNVGGAVTGTLTHVNTATDALTGTAGAASQSLTILTAHIDPAIDTANATIAKAGTAIDTLPPLVNHATIAVGDLDAFINSPDFLGTVSNVHNLTGEFVTTTSTFNHMLDTGDQVETKLARCTLHPTFSCFVKSDILFGAQVGGYLLPK